MNDSIRIIGWGNLGRRDDGVALRLIERLREMPALNNLPLQFMENHQLGPEAAVDVADAGCVVFVDAHVDADRPLVCWESVEADASGSLDSHHCSPGTLLAICRSMGWRTPPCHQLAIRAFDCSFGDTLTPQCTALVNQAAQWLATHLERHAHDLDLSNNVDPFESVPEKIESIQLA